MPSRAFLIHPMGGLKIQIEFQLKLRVVKRTYMATPAKITVVKGADLAVALRAPKSVVIKKKKNAKSYKGSEFHDVFFMIPGILKPKPGIFFSFVDFVIHSGISEPTLDQAGNIVPDDERQRLQVNTTLSKAGVFGDVYTALEPAYIAAVNAAVEAGEFELPKTGIVDIIRRKYGKKAKPEMRGKPREDPIVYIPISFEKYNEKMGALAGKTRTEILDFDTEYIDGNGHKKYKVAAVPNDAGVMEPLNPMNAHKFITSGSVIKFGRCNVGAVCTSNFGCSLKAEMQFLVIQSNRGGGKVFDDEDEFGTYDVLPEGAKTSADIKLEADQVDELLNHI